MGLQIRVRQKSGEKTIHLTDRSIDRPAVIGSGQAAQVRIASDAVAPEQCALFVHEGRWVLHDVSGGQTMINGKAVKRPTKLRVGDTVSLGAGESAPTIVIDPVGAGAGRTGQPAMGGGDAPKSPAKPNAAPAKPRPAPSMPKPVPAPAPAAPPAPVVEEEPAPVENYEDQPTAVESDPFAELASAATSSRPPAADGSTPRRKPPKKNSNAGMIVGAVVCLAIVGGTAWFAVQRLKHPPVVKVIELPAPKPTTRARIASAVDPLRPMAGDIAPVKRHAAPVAPTPVRDDTDPDDGSSAAATRPGGAAAGSTTGPASAKDDTWSEIEAASYLPEYGVALLKFDDYRRQHPTQFTKELDEFTAQALDRLWWHRIKLLCDKRDRLTLELRKKNEEIKEEPSVSFRKTLTDEKKAMDDEMARTLTALSGDMGYSSDDAPDLTNEEALTKLAVERDAVKFGAWKISVLKYIRTHHGSTPWEGDN